MTEADLPGLRAIMQDAETMTAYEGAYSEAETVAWLDWQLANYREYGFGLWAVVLKETDTMIGQCGITWQDIDGHRVLEVGYLFNRAFWHHGYAIEAARACRDWAFTQLGACEVFAQVRDTNIASMNVAIRMGMTIRSRFTKHFRGVDMPHFAFAITREAWMLSTHNTGAWPRSTVEEDSGA
jgi:RimJ/RimL family protein N-acetyltransferase